MFGKQLFLCATNKQEYHFLNSHAACSASSKQTFPGDEAFSVCALCVGPAFFLFTPANPHSTRLLLLLLLQTLGGIKWVTLVIFTESTKQNLDETELDVSEKRRDFQLAMLLSYQEHPLSPVALKSELARAAVDWPEGSSTVTV